MVNSRDVQLLRQDVAANCRCWLERCRCCGLPVLITNTVRDAEYQQYLYQQGRTRPGGIVTNSPVPTFHADHAGLAFDFCKNVKGQEYSDQDFFRQAAGLAKEMGFTWGGDWKTFVDMPHLQWDDGGRWTNAMILRGEYPPPMPLFEEDEETTEEAFAQMLEAYFARRREEAPGKWSQAARQWAEGKGLIAGDEQGNMAYKMFTTREELVEILRRLETGRTKES